MYDRLTKIRKEVFEIFLDLDLRRQIQINFLFHKEGERSIEITFMHKLEKIKE